MKIHFNNLYKLVFHDTEYPSSDEQDYMNDLQYSGPKNMRWDKIGYGRKYDGEKFQLGSTCRSRDEQNPVVKELNSPDFEEWMNRQWQNSGRESANFCSILIYEAGYRRVLRDSLCNIDPSNVVSIQIGESVLKDPSEIEQLTKSFKSIDPDIQSMLNRSSSTPLIINLDVGTKYYYSLNRIQINDKTQGITLNFGTKPALFYNSIDSYGVLSTSMSTTLTELRIKI